MIDREAIRQAWDEVEAYCDHTDLCRYLPYNPPQAPCTCGYKDAVTALRQALAQPEQSCSCGEPDALGVVHRKDSPCYVAQNPLDIADRAYFAGKQAGIVETLAQPESQVCCGDYEKCMKACTPRGQWLAEKELAQPEQVPVAWKCCPPGKCAYRQIHKKATCPHENLPADTAPPSKPQDVDVGIDVTELGTHLVVRRGNEVIKSEFYHAPKREWVSLTDEEIDYIWGVTPPDYENFFEFPRAIEAALRSKNEG